LHEIKKRPTQKRNDLNPDTPNFQRVLKKKKEKKKRKKEEREKKKKKRKGKKSPKPNLATPAPTNKKKQKKKNLGSPKKDESPRGAQSLRNPCGGEENSKERNDPSYQANLQNPSPCMGPHVFPNKKPRERRGKEKNTASEKARRVPFWREP